MVSATSSQGPRILEQRSGTGKLAGQRSSLAGADRDGVYFDDMLVLAKLGLMTEV